MFYAGFYSEEVAETLPALLLKAKINPRKVTKDFGTLPTRIDWHLQIARTDFIVYPIDRYFNRKAFSLAFKMINEGRTILFVDFETGGFLTFNRKKVHSQSFNSRFEKVLFRLSMYTSKRYNPLFDALVEVAGASRAARMVKALEKQAFVNLVDRLFDSLDVTLTGKPQEQTIQKLIYIELFTKNPDTDLLREQFGDDKEFKALTIQQLWKQSLKLDIDHTKLYQDFEVESFGDITYFEDTIYKREC